MYIPNCREKRITMPYAKEDQENGYYEGYLNEKDKEFIKGYDWSTQHIKDTLKYNLEDHVSDFDIKGEDINLATFLENHKKILDALVEMIEECMETERDEMIVSMIDNMDEDEYEKIKAEVNKDDNPGTK